MKKLLLLFLLVAGGVSTASADDTWYLAGTFNSWALNGDNVKTFTDGSVTVALEEGVSYPFKVVKVPDEGEATWYGQGPSSISVSSYSQVLGSGDNITITAGAAGTYTFYLDTSDASYPRISVKYPDCEWKLMGKLYGADGDLAELATFSDGTASVSMAENSTYEFKIQITDGATFGNDGTMSYVNSSAWNFYSDNGNCKIKATDAGTYTFAINASGVDPKITVTYPSYETYTVYLYDNLSWGTHYAYPLTFPRWDNDASYGGTGSKESCDGIAMTQVGTSNVWKADYRYAGSTYIAFAETAQNDYEKFWNNKAIYRGDLTKESRIYVPSTTSSGTTNGTTYYNDGAWHPFPTYTRSVSMGNYGTICLPFNATITGATIYEIANTVGSGETLRGIIIEEVAGNNVEAGKAYIFKATGSTLTASMSGNYSEATEAQGMLGNIGSGTINVPTGNYVISGNKIHKVVAGEGDDHVTIGQYRAYITLTSISALAEAARGANFISFEDETTGINSFTSTQNDGVVYDLQGRKVAQPTKGLYIVNGKKVIK